MKSTIKYSRIVIVFLVVVVTVIAIWNKVLLNRCARNYQLQKKQISESQKKNEKTAEAVIKAQTAAMMHLGKKLKLNGMELFFPKNGATEPKPTNHPRLILVFSELSCNVCQDKETEFAITIVADFGQDYVTAIVHAVKKRYIQNYTRMNQVNFPVYYCDDKDRAFLADNKIIHTPVLFVIDENSRILAAHMPIPGHPEYSEPIHQFCYHYFGNSSNDD